MLRLFVDTALAAGDALELPPGPARHLQVRRLQPGDALLLFDGRGGEWCARVRQMGRQ
jgi:16S rRNA (uracil1498-N3)-methyltransferase